MEKIDKRKSASKEITTRDERRGCPYDKKCGGCQWSRLSYPEQLKKSRRR